MSAQLISGGSNKEAFKALKNIDRLVKRGVGKAARKAGLALVAETARAIFEKPKGGETVFKKIGGRGRPRRHVTSAPGETFANTTGLWVKTLGYQVLGSDGLEFGFGAGNGNPPPEQAKDLEFGTKNLKARPTIQNGIMMAEETIIAHLENEIGALLKC